MGIRNLMVSTLGLGRRNDSVMERDLNGIVASRDETYAGDGRDGRSADIVWNRESPAPMPVVIFFNGYGFVHPDRRRGCGLCGIVAKRDRLVVNAGFRNPGRDVKVTDCIGDCLNMVSWLSANSGKYQMDLGNVVVTGSSYGALMALWLTMVLSGNRLSDALGAENPGIKVTGLGLFTGMTDISGGDADMRNIAAGIKRIRREDNDLGTALDPRTNHDLRTLPPVFQVTSDIDSARHDVAGLGRLLDTNGVPNETMVFDGSIRTMRGFMEQHPNGNECARALSRMFGFVERNQ